VAFTENHFTVLICGTEVDGPSSCCSSTLWGRGERYGYPFI